MLEVIRRIEALSAKSEFAIVTLGAFGYFSFLSVYSAFNPSQLPPISQQGLHGLIIFESIVLSLLVLLLHLRGWTWKRAASYIFGNRIQRIQRAHFIGTHFAAVDYHPVIKANDSVAAGTCMSPRKHRVKETCNGAAQHGPAKAQRMATMLKVRLAYGSGVIREQPANGSKCHVYGPPRFGQSRASSRRTIARSIRA
jgi:hypothetical protein